MPNKRYVEVAGRQHGVLKASDLELTRAGIAYRVEAGLLYPRYHGVYSLMPTLTRDGEWLAAVYAAGGGAALTSLNAGVLANISRFKPVGITVAVPKRRRPQGFKLIVGLDPRDVRTRNGIPVTSVERLLVDVPLPAEQRANLIHEAAFRGRFSVAATRRVMARVPQRGLKPLERAIEMHLAGSAGTRSDLEDRFLALVRGARLPEPVINTHIHGVEVDFRWGDYCVEVDGPGHQRPATRAKDEADDAWLRSRGLTVVRFTDAAIDREPRRVLRELTAQHLARRTGRGRRAAAGGRDRARSRA
jgi:very-short-patch-repair endonuclease